jgi:hypothetical protein
MTEQTALQLNNQFVSSLDNEFKGDQGFYRCRNCNTNLTSNSPASQYQKQKLIQKVVRVPQSLFTMNLGALSTYQSPLTQYQYVDINGAVYPVAPGVNWNQMSDRREPHIQTVVTSSGSAYGGNSTKRSLVRNRPGAMSPGGTGVDIKHNSYDRYLNRLKGKKPLKRGLIPPTFGQPIPFNNAYPVYGNKQMKLGIVNGCNCFNTVDSKLSLEKKLYLEKEQYEIMNVKFTFNVGDYVWAYKAGTENYYKAIIISISGGLYNVKYTIDGSFGYNLTGSQIKIYFDCDKCGLNQSNEILYKYYVNGIIEGCNIPETIINTTAI